VISDLFFSNARRFLRKSFNDHLDKIEKQTVEEMVSVEQTLQVQLKNVLVSMEAKRTHFDHIRQHLYRHTSYPYFEN
jgi:hypothetical protein